MPFVSYPSWKREINDFIILPGLGSESAELDHVEDLESEMTDSSRSSKSVNFPTLYEICCLSCSQNFWNGAFLKNWCQIDNFNDCRRFFSSVPSSSVFKLQCLHSLISSIQSLALQPPANQHDPAVENIEFQSWQSFLPILPRTANPVVYTMSADFSKRFPESIEKSKWK